MKPCRTSSRRLLPPSVAWLARPYMYATCRALIVQRHGTVIALPPLMLLENVVGQWGTEGGAGVSVARDSHMIALPQQRHEVASRLGELA
jgi:hypothetical protein